MKKLNKVPSLNGIISVPGDKSISHRSLILGAMATGITTVSNLLNSADVNTTKQVLVDLGVDIWNEAGVTKINGKGGDNFHDPKNVLDMGNSGTSTRLLTGLISGAGLYARIIGDDSLSKRPMDRVTKPLNSFGAKIESNNGRLPMNIHRSRLNKEIKFELQVGSAQVKSAVMLAGIVNGSKTTIIDNFNTRNHTEVMLKQFGAEIEVAGAEISIPADQHLHSVNVAVPGDISSAAFWIVAGLLVKDSNLTIKNVGLNPTRSGIIKILQEMNAKIDIKRVNDDGEIVADIKPHFSQLTAMNIGGKVIPTCIDEIPILALAATQAEGRTIIKDASELRVKESNRITTVTTELNKLGANIQATEDGFIIYGPTKLHSNDVHVSSNKDHRIAMMLAIAALITEGNVILEDDDSVGISYPTFFSDLERVVAK
ncbi:3-phosphoshikimate 1-carboxyvinyltransferase [Companilactobacillus insicii]|uniref:3-phosphoshikimate 1-carboxyvinyltransferase n=1 Tax=Companilactobacillus insicii TaxID=1732567 RepID=UPI000F770EE5|nr:3-phosphoshikimate 1-carboxyvinyltransferase [Companilactobacillus insicii]